MACAEFVAESGARLEYVTPERILAPEVGGMNYPAYFRVFDERDVVLDPQPAAHWRAPRR